MKRTCKEHLTAHRPSRTVDTHTDTVLLFCFCAFERARARIRTRNRARILARGWARPRSFALLSHKKAPPLTGREKKSGGDFAPYKLGYSLDRAQWPDVLSNQHKAHGPTYLPYANLSYRNLRDAQLRADLSPVLLS